MSEAPSATGTATALARRLLDGDRLALSRVISRLESRDRASAEILKEIFPRTGRAQIWGVTGPPGAGKSTLVDRMVADLRSRGLQVAVVAVDPSSPFTGGAILGDRIRMQDHAVDPKVFIRSLGTRGRQGGLSHATLETVLALDAAGFDVILVETAGVGQTELEILGLAHEVVVVLVPESGDAVQMMKAGILEIADLFAVNKSDRPDADRLVNHLEASLDLLPAGSRRPAVLKTRAIEGAGVRELVDALFELGRDSASRRAERTRGMLKRAVLHILTERLEASVLACFETTSGVDLLRQLESRQLDPHAVADLISGN